MKELEETIERQQDKLNIIRQEFIHDTRELAQRLTTVARDVETGYSCGIVHGVIGGLGARVEHGYSAMVANEEALRMLLALKRKLTQAPSADGG